jgi:hypothetical protein
MRETVSFFGALSLNVTPRSLFAAWRKSLSSVVAFPWRYWTELNFLSLPIANLEWNVISHFRHIISPTQSREGAISHGVPRVGLSQY